MDYSTNNTSAQKTTFPLDQLIQHFSLFKGIGFKTAQRLALEAIVMPKEKITAFSNALVHAKENIKFCTTCHYLTWETQCYICLDAERNTDTICVVSEPKDVLAIEQSKMYKGVYHVLGGIISPLDGIYPEMLRFKELRQRVMQGHVKELVLALNPTVEGDTTILYLQDFLADLSIPMYKLAQGIPIGSDLAYLDEVTIHKAFEGKQLL